MKKAIALFILLLANITILVHAFVPHHHHENIPFCISSHCVDSNIAHDSSTSCDPHQHEGNSSSGDCLIDNIYTRATNDRQVLDSGDNDYTQLPHFLLLFCSDCFIKLSNTEAKKIELTPYLSSYHTTFVTRSLGLRAPPVC